MTKFKPTAKRAKSNAAFDKRQPQFRADAKISVLAQENPKRKGSAAHRRFAKYKSGQTVAEALTAGVQREYLRWDARRKFIKVA